MNAWDRRIERAQDLEHDYPSAAELLAFYTHIARFQKKVQATLRTAPPASPPFSLHPAEIPEPLRRHVCDLLTLIQQAGPADLAEVAGWLLQSEDWDPADPAPRFVTRVLLQPYAQHMAVGGVLSPDIASTCPFCGELPVTAVLRPEGDGGKRSLVCSLCFGEWEFRRLVCPKCGEEDQPKLPVYTAEPFPHIRIEACDTCRTYLKSIDMTRNGLAVPEVDELAAVPLDIWAAENHYTKLQPNLFGL